MRRSRTRQHSVRVRGAYFSWLVKYIEQGDKYGTSDEVKSLLWILYDTEFYELIKNDQNRSDDGIQLRRIFREETGINQTHDMEKCSLLEMLIALSDRLDFILSEGRSRKRREWFWMLIDNLDLEPFSLDSPYIKEIASTNELKIKTFLERKYKCNGRGGLFPLKRPTQDQTKIEIWYQMMAYIDEIS